VTVASSALAAASQFPAMVAPPAGSTSIAGLWRHHLITVVMQRRLCEISRRKIATVAHVSI
jgi:hypothetical protein